ncbi:MAG: hypothetical protein ACRC9X_08135 [Bacteroidales bacterium]
MKLLITILFTSFIFCAHAQKFGVVCTYDYEQTLSENDINNFDKKNIPLLSYLVAKDTANSITLTKKSSFEKMMQGFLSHNNLVLYIHGDRSLLSELLATGDKIKHEYEADFLLFVWPSNEIKNSNRKNYENSKINSLVVTPQFVETIESTSKFCEQNGIKLTVMFHSLGNFFAKNFARHSIYQNNFTQLHINHILLNAACVWGNDHDIWVDIIAKRIKGNIYITQNEDDVILNLAKVFIEKGDLLGKTIPEIKSRNAIYVNFTETLKGQSSIQEGHEYFIGDIMKRKPQLKMFYQQVFNGETVNKIIY